MYEYLTGIVTNVNPSYVVLEVAGVGYKLFSANPYRYQPNSEKLVTIYVYQAVRENEIALYGLTDEEEKQLFEQLLNVSGIGPKSALAILANEDHSGLVNAIMNDDVSYLTKFPGVGKKTASQIVLDLKDKIQKIASTTTADTVEEADPTTGNQQLDDALAALNALGYKAKEVQKVGQALANQSGATTDEYLRQALTLLTK